MKTFKLDVWELGKFMFETTIIAGSFTSSEVEGKSTLVFWESTEPSPGETPLYTIGITGTYRLKLIK